MEKIFRISLFIVGIINFLPSLLAFLPEKLSKSYGIEIPDTDFELLLRHRATLFGIIGGLMLYSSITKKHYQISITVGLISMVSFVLLYFLIDGINEDLGKIMKIDLAAILILTVGFLLYKSELHKSGFL